MEMTISKLLTVSSGVTVSTSSTRTCYPQLLSNNRDGEQGEFSGNWPGGLCGSLRLKLMTWPRKRVGVRGREEEGRGIQGSCCERRDDCWSRGPGLSPLLNGSMASLSWRGRPFVPRSVEAAPG